LVENICRESCEYMKWTANITSHSKMESGTGIWSSQAAVPSCSFGIMQGIIIALRLQANRCLAVSLAMQSAYINVDTYIGQTVSHTYK